MRTDDDLMAGIVAGDEYATEALVNRWQRRLIAYFHQRLNDEQAAEDCTQDVLVKVYTNASSYEPRGMFHAWLWRIAKHRLIDETRRRKHDPIRKSICNQRDDDVDAVASLAGNSVDPSVAAEASDYASNRELVDVVRLANTLLEAIDERFEAMPPGKLATIDMAADGQTHSEIAYALGVSLGTVKGRIGHGRRKAMACL